jgi:hypothetical protein
MRVLNDLWREPQVNHALADVFQPKAEIPSHLWRNNLVGQNFFDANPLMVQDFTLFTDRVAVHICLTCLTPYHVELTERKVILTHCTGEQTLILRKVIPNSPILAKGEKNPSEM